MKKNTLRKIITLLYCGLLIVTIAVCSLCGIGANIQNINKNIDIAKATGEDFEFYFKTTQDGKSQIGLNELANYTDAQGRIKLDLYISALSAPSYEVASIVGSAHFNSNIITNDITILSIPNDEEYYMPLWTSIISKPSDGSKAEVSLGFTVNPDLEAEYKMPNITITQDNKIATVILKVIDKNPTVPSTITWDFTDVGNNPSTFSKKTGDNSFIDYDMNNVKFTPFYIGEPMAEPSADLETLSLKGQQATPIEYILGFNPETITYNTLMIPYAQSQGGLMLDFTKKSSTATTEVTFSSGSTADYNNTTGLITGLANGDKIYVKVDDGEEISKTYTITANVQTANSNADLKSLSASAGTLSPTFNKNTQAYTVALPNNKMSVKLTAIADDSSATVSIDGTQATEKTFSGLAVGSINTDIVVTAEDGITTKTYTVTITRLSASSNTALESIKVNNNPVVMPAETNNYTYLLLENQTSFTFSILGKEPSNQTVEYKVDDGEYKVMIPNTSNGAGIGIAKGGSVAISINVTAQDNSYDVYTLTVTRESSTNTELSNVSVTEGDTTKNITPIGDIYSYTLGNTGAEYITINALGKTGENSTVKILYGGVEMTGGVIWINSLEPGTHNYIIEVTSQSGESVKKNYTLNIIKKSSEKTLFTPAVYHPTSANFIGDMVFDEASNTYSIIIDYKFEGVIINNLEIRFKASKGSTISASEWSGFRTGNPIDGYTTAFVDINFQNDSTQKYIHQKVLVTAEGGGDPAEYYIRITRKAADTDATLDEITIEGIPFDGFNSHVTSYPNPVIFSSETESVYIEAKRNSDFATVTYNGGTNSQISLTEGIKKEVQIKVTSESGHSITYTIYLIAANTDNSITDIKLYKTSDEYIGGFFELGNTGPYVIEVPYTVEYIKIAVETPLGAKSTIEGAGGFVQLNELTNNFTVTVISQAGQRGEAHTIKIVRNPARTENKLETLTISSDGVDNYINFNPENDKYTIRVDRSVTSLKINATVPADDGSTIISGLTDNFALTAGATIATFVQVRAENNSVKKYEITITCKDDDFTINNIITTPQNITFNESNLEYNLPPVKFAVKKIGFNVSLNNNYAELWMIVNNGTAVKITSPNNFEANLSEGENNIVIYAVSEFGSKGKEYEFNVKQNSASSDATLSSLTVKVSGVDLLTGANEFNPEKDEYTLRVDRGTSNILIEAFANDTNATILKSYTSGSLNYGENIFTLKVTAEDDETEKLYTIKVTRANDNAIIDNIITSPTNIVFDKEEEVYNLGAVAFSTFVVNFKVALADNFAKLYMVINGAFPEEVTQRQQSFDADIAQGENTIVIYAVSEFGSKGTEYKFNVTRNEICTDSSLESLQVLSGGANGVDLLVGDNAFSADINSYELRVDDVVSLIQIKAKATSTTSKITISPQSGALSKGHNNFTVSVVAENGDESVYEIRVIRADDNNTITEIKVNDVSIPLNANNPTILAELPFTEKTIKIEATLENSTATLYGVGAELDLKDGENIFKVYAISKYGSYIGHNKNDVDVYVIKVVRTPAQTDNKLENLVVEDNNGNVLPFNDEIEFDPDYFVYNITLSEESTIAQIKIIATGETNNKVVTGKTGLQPLTVVGGKINNQFIITVTSESGVAQNYTINVTKGTALNNDTTIKEVTLKDLNGESYLNFNANIENQLDIVLPYDISGLILTIIPVDPNAQVSGTQGNISVNPGGSVNVSFKIIAQDGTEGEKTYKFKISRKTAQTDKYLDTLTVKDINGGELDFLSEVFDKDTLTYNLRVDDSVTGVKITATVPTDNGSQIMSTIQPSYLLASGATTQISIIVKAENGEFATYTLNIKRANNDNKIASIVLNGVVVDVTEFLKSGNNYEYEIEPDYIHSISTLNIAVNLENPNSKASISGAGLKDLEENKTNRFEIVVTAQDGTIGDTYVIRVKRLSASNDNSLSNLKITDSNDFVLLNKTDSIDGPYSFVVNRTVTSIYIDANKNHMGATISGDIGENSLIAGQSNIFKVFIKSESGDTKTYIINVLVKDDDNKISNITSSLPTLSFDESVNIYNLDDVLFSVDKIILSFVLNSEFSKLFVNGIVQNNLSNVSFDLVAGQDNVFEIYAVAEDETPSSVVYTINVNRGLADTNNYLSNLVVTDLSDQEIAFIEGDFNKENLDYTIILDINSEINAIKINAVAENGTTPTGIGEHQLVEVAGIISNKFTVSVTAENGVVKNYSVTVVKGSNEGLSGDFEIEDISLLGKGVEYLKNEFLSDTAIQQPILVPYEVDSVYLSITAHAKATIIGTGLYNIGAGETITIEFKVTAENGISGLLYKVEVTRENAKVDNELTQLYYEVDGVRYPLDPTSELHDINIKNNITQIVIGGVAPDGAEVAGFGVFDLIGNKITKVVTVKAENGDFKNYVLNIIRQSDNATIKSIKIDGVERFGEFIDNRYEFSVPYSKESIGVLATANSLGATIEGNGNYALLEGENDIVIYAVSEAGTKGDNYLIKVIRENASNNNNLRSLIVRDNATGEPLLLQPNFTKTQLKYRIDLTDFDDVREISIEAIAESLVAKKVEGTGVFILKTEVGQTSEIFTVTVTAENGTIKKYDITITRQVNPENDINIDDLTLIGSDGINYLGTSGLALTMFELSKFNYQMTVPFKVKNMTLTAINNNGATVSGNGNYVLSDTEDTIISLNVVSRSGLVESQTYTITIIKKQPNSDNNLSSLTIDGVLIDEFNPLKTTYNVTVSLEDVTSVRITATASHPEAKVIGDLGLVDLQPGNNTVNITVTAEDGTPKLYTVTIKRISTDNKILDLGVTGYTLSNPFEQTNKNYSLTVPYTTEMVNVYALANPKATIMGIGHTPLQLGENVVEVYAVSEQGEKGIVYRLTITRKLASDDNTLKSLSVLSDGGQALTFNPTFNPLTTSYIINLPEDSSVNALEIFAEANCPLSKGVGGTGYKVLKTTVDGKYNNIFEIIVMAENGTTKTYTISVYRNVELANDITIGEVNLIGSDGIKYLGSNGAITKFVTNIENYTVIVPYFVESVTLEMGSISATVYGTGTKVFGNSDIVEFNAYLISQSGEVTSNTYTITVERTLALDDNSLRFIKVNGADIQGFSPEITQYEISIPYLSTNRVIISAQPFDATSEILSGVGSFNVIEGRNVFSILVKAQSGATRSYNVVITYLNNNALLESLSLQGSTSSIFNDDDAENYIFEFNPETNEYTVTVDKSIKTINIKGAAQDQQHAAIIGLGKYSLTDDKTKIVVNVVAADNTTVNTYVLNIKKSDIPSNNSKLKDLVIGGYGLAFNSDVYIYTLKVKKGTEGLDLRAIAQDPNARVTVIGDQGIEEGKNAILIMVEAENGSMSVYQLIVTRDASPDYFMTVLLIVVFLLWIITIVIKLISVYSKKREEERDY